MNEDEVWMRATAAAIAGAQALALSGELPEYEEIDDEEEASRIAEYAANVGDEVVARWKARYAEDAEDET